MSLFLEHTTFTSATSAGVAMRIQTQCLCPRCGALLDEQVVSGEGAFTCASCRGWWIPEGVLTRLHHAHRRGTLSTPLDERALYTRAALIQSKRDERVAFYRRRRHGSSIELVYWLSLFGIGSLATGLVIWESLRRAIARGHWTGKADDGLFILALGVVGGIAIFLYGFRLHHRKRLIETTPTSPIRSLAVGLVEITGKAEITGGTLKAPFSAMPCVFFFYRVEERRRVGKENKWVTIAKGQSDQSFAVRDPTGAVMIMPVGCELMIETRGTFQSGGHFDLSPTVEAGLASLGISTSGRLSSKTLRCTEGFILPGETIYVLGTAQAGDQNQIANEARLFIGHHPDGTFIISDRSERELLSTLRWQVLALVYGGPALTAACVWGLLHSYIAVIP